MIYLANFKRRYEKEKPNPELAQLRQELSPKIKQDKRTKKYKDKVKRLRQLTGGESGQKKTGKIQDFYERFSIKERQSPNANKAKVYSAYTDVFPSTQGKQPLPELKKVVRVKRPLTKEERLRRVKIGRKLAKGQSTLNYEYPVQPRPQPLPQLTNKASYELLNPNMPEGRVQTITVDTPKKPPTKPRVIDIEWMDKPVPEVKLPVHPAKTVETVKSSKLKATSSNVVTPKNSKRLGVKLLGGLAVAGIAGYGVRKIRKDKGKKRGNYRKRLN